MGIVTRRVAAAAEFDHVGTQFVADAPGRRSAAVAVHEGGCAFALETCAQTADVALRQVQDRRCLRYRPAPCLHFAYHSQTLLLPLVQGDGVLSAHERTASPSSRAGQIH